MLTNIDVLDVCAVMLQRCGLSAEQLAAHMRREDLPSAAPQQSPAAPGAQDAAHMTPRLLQVLDRCDCADGMSARDLEVALGIANQTAFAYLNDLHGMGRVTRVKLAGRPGARYFAMPAHALAWQDSHAAAKQAAVAVTRPAPKVAAAPKPARSTVAVGPFVQAIARPTGEVIIPAHVVIQRAAPAVDTRMQVKPGDPLTGGFSTSRPGINPLTGLGWGVAA